VFLPPLMVATALGSEPPLNCPESTRIASLISTMPFPPQAVIVMTPVLPKSSRTTALVRSMMTSEPQVWPEPEAEVVMVSAIRTQAPEKSAIPFAVTVMLLSMPPPKELGGQSPCAPARTLPLLETSLIASREPTVWIDVPVRMRSPAPEAAGPDAVRVTLFPPRVPPLAQIFPFLDSSSTASPLERTDELLMMKFPQAVIFSPPLELLSKTEVDSRSIVAALSQVDPEPLPAVIWMPLVPVVVMEPPPGPSTFSEWTLILMPSVDASCCSAHLSTTFLVG